MPRTFNSNLGQAWPEVRQAASRFDGLEIVVEIGANDSEASRALMGDIRRLVAEYGAKAFPAVISPPPCSGCGEGAK